jgi:hypothetical protein
LGILDNNSKMRIALILVLLAFGICNAQKNTLYVSLQPVDMGVGLRYDRVITKKIGVYSSIAYGNYRLPYEGYIKDHIRAVIGGLYYLKPDRYIKPSFGIGLIYSYYGDRYITIADFEDSVLHPFSFELGINTKIRRFAAGVRYDPVKNESAVDIGITF